MAMSSRRLLAIAFTAIAAAVPLQAQGKSNLLTLEEIERAELSASSAYEAVALLRPRWLAKHEPLQGLEVLVYLNDRRVGDADYLRTIPADRVLEMRWYSSSQATSRFGQPQGAAIEVSLKQ